MTTTMSRRLLLLVLVTITSSYVSVTADVSNTLVQVTEPVQDSTPVDNGDSGIVDPAVVSVAHVPQSGKEVPTREEPVSSRIDEGEQTVRIVIQYDAVPDETTFLIREHDRVIYRGPTDYAPDPNEKWETTFDQFPVGSFTFVLLDSADNGMGSGNVLGHFEIWQAFSDGSEIMLAEGDHDFQSRVTTGFQVGAQSQQSRQTQVAEPRLPVVELVLQVFTLNLLEGYVGFAGLGQQISRNDITFTMMAPWNFGFQRLNDPLLDKLANPRWTAHLRNLIEYHMFDENLPEASLNPPQTLTMMNGETLEITLTGGPTPRIQINGVNLVTTYDATNGFVYMLDRVLIPAWVNRDLLDLAASHATTFLSWIARAGLDPGLQNPRGSLTIFAPSNDAFERLSPAVSDYLFSEEGAHDLKDIVNYHVVPNGPFPSSLFRSDPMETLQGKTLRIVPGMDLAVLGDTNQAYFTMMDQVAYNGLVHVIDAVLLVEPLSFVTAGPSSPPSASPTAHPATKSPSSSPTAHPSTDSPSSSPTAHPSTNSPSSSPTAHPSTDSPSSSPTAHPSTDSPSSSPTAKPSTHSPSSRPSPPPQPMAWIQLGQNIEGREAGDLFSYVSSLSLNGDGTVVAGGAPESNGRVGYARVFRYSDFVWTQLGQDIEGNNAGNEFGSSLELSAGGDTLAVAATGGSSESGYINVYRYDTFVNLWVSLGQTVSGRSQGNDYGDSLALSGDGGTFATGFRSIFVPGGGVRVYRLNTSADRWQPLGQALNDDDVAGSHRFGRSVSLSDNGTIVAVGAPYHANGAQVQVFRLNGGTWELLGDPVKGTGNFDQFGASVSLSANGLVMAAGAISNSRNGALAGQVIVHKYNEGVNAWQQLGQILYGEAGGDFFGDSVDLSSDGMTLAVGAPTTGGDTNTFSGTAYVYQYDGVTEEWAILGPVIVGEGEFDLWGDSIALSAGGGRLAAGARYNDGNGADSGHVRVFELS